MSYQRHYEFLDKYHSSNYPKGEVIPWPNNVFCRVSEEEILEAEKMLGYQFPSQLRQFYQEIGSGALVVPHTPTPDYDFFGANEILAPLTVARFALGILEWEGQDRWMAEDVYEDYIKEGELPFFELSNSSSFMTLKAKSEHPNAVWFLGMNLVEDSFETFIRNLYYDDPNYYVRGW